MRPDCFWGKCLLVFIKLYQISIKNKIYTLIMIIEFFLNNFKKIPIPDVINSTLTIFNKFDT
jgi:hypothetical protein